MPDPNLKGVVEAAQWFCFSDTIQNQINHLQNYAVYPYLQYGFIVWHLLFASLAWPKINFPTKGYEVKNPSLLYHNFCHFQPSPQSVQLSFMVALFCLLVL